MQGNELKDNEKAILEVQVVESMEIYNVNPVPGRFTSD